MVRRCYHIERKQGHPLRQEHSDLRALETCFIRLFAHIKKITISLKNMIITMFFLLDMHRCARMLMGIFCLVLFRVIAS